MEPTFSNIIIVFTQAIFVGLLTTGGAYTYNIITEIRYAKEQNRQEPQESPLLQELRALATEDDASDDSDGDSGADGPKVHRDGQHQSLLTELQAGRPGSTCAQNGNVELGGQSGSGHQENTLSPP